MTSRSSIQKAQDRVEHITNMTKEMTDMAQQINRFALELRSTDLPAKCHVSEMTKIEDELTILWSQSKHVKRELETMIKEGPLLGPKEYTRPASIPQTKKKPQVGEGTFKLQAISGKKVPRWRQYADWVVGKASLKGILKYELITGILGSFPGAPGYFLRSKIYPWLLGEVGANTVIGRGVTLRHPHKIRLGKNVTIDDYSVLDAKGQSNTGIHIGDDVYIGRNSIVYCKDGDIEIQSRANIGTHCEIFSGDRVLVGNGSMVAAYCYIMSGNSYDYESQVAFADQKVYTKGPTTIGRNCWLGTKVVVLDGVTIEEGAVVGAGAVVTNNVPPRTVSMGVPAKSRFSRDPELHTRS